MAGSKFTAPLMVKERTVGGLSLNDAHRALRHCVEFNGFILLPSDTGIALAVDPRSKPGVAVIRTVLQRPDAPLPLSAASCRQVRKVVTLGKYHVRVAAAVWPGPVTLVAPAAGRWTHDIVRAKVGGADRTLGLRITDSRVERDLATEADIPLTTAAVRHADGSIVRTFDEAMDIVGAAMQDLPPLPWAAIRPSGRLAHPRESSVIRLKADGSIERIRPGAVDLDVIKLSASRPSAEEYADAT